MTQADDYIIVLFLILIVIIQQPRWVREALRMKLSLKLQYLGRFVVSLARVFVNDKNSWPPLSVIFRDRGDFWAKPRSRRQPSPTSRLWLMSRVQSIFFLWLRIWLLYVLCQVIFYGHLYGFSMLSQKWCCWYGGGRLVPLGHVLTAFESGNESGVFSHFARSWLPFSYLRGRLNGDQVFERGFPLRGACITGQEVDSA